VEEFTKAFSELNDEQKKAVEQIDGPVLVIAGPGTGKTQLLSTRVGYILQNTDALAQNILCLTFTEAGVQAMRERLTRFLGQDAYDVHISTYHAFGSELIRRYPEYAGGYGFEPIDDLGSDSIIRQILADSPYSNPLKSADVYAHNLRDFMSECKRALLSPKDVSQLAKSNLDFIALASGVTLEVLKGFARIDKNSPVLFEKLLAGLQSISIKKPAKFIALKTEAIQSLEEALQAAADSGKTKAITAWKDRWLAKDSEGRFIFAGTQANQKIAAAADIYSAYQKQLAKRKLYDYDDMILRAIEALQTNPDFKFTLAEQYQFIMLDEFQDTNPAQLKIVELLTDNPVNEGRPNVLAVGDDDQAIYAFQGAEHTNMARFAQMYRDVRVISLRKNYRSHAQILDAAYNLSGQIKERLHHQFEGITKILQQAGKDLPKDATIAHHEFISDAAQYSWVTDEIKRLIKQEKFEPAQIAVLAPRHKYLLPLLPYLASAGLPVRYEKRENVLDKPIVRQLEQMSRLVVALYAQNYQLADSLWPEVVSYDFWGLSSDEIWQVSWKAYQARDGWTNALLGSAKTRPLTEFILRVKDLLGVTNLEQQLDILTGISKDDVRLFELPIRSPLYEFYFGAKSSQGTDYLDLISDLSVLRAKLRAWRRGENRPLNLADFMTFIDEHRAANINILNTNPHYEASSALNVMTAYQAKGREFGAVFLLAAQDEVWGAASRTASSNLSLPPNLDYIRYRGSNDDERLRLLYVAITRAKSHLYLTSYAATLDGKASRPLKYLAGQADLLPTAIKHTGQSVASAVLQDYWHQRHLPPFTPKLTDRLAPVLDNYQLSPTHLNQFTDVIRGGPQQFFFNTILRFPAAQAPSAAYGTAVHDTLSWVHNTNAKDKKLPDIKRVLAFFNEQLAAKRLAPDEQARLGVRGEEALRAYLEQKAGSFSPNDKFEQNFRGQGVFIGPAHLTGKIDKLVINKAAKTVTVFDFKTGRSYDRWRGEVVQLHKYRQQLMAYKLLIEGSHDYAGYKVEQGILEFVEPDANGQIKQLVLEFNAKDLEDFKKLNVAVWQRIKALDFPDISKYPKNTSGIRAFEADLLK